MNPSPVLELCEHVDVGAVLCRWGHPDGSLLNLSLATSDSELLLAMPELHWPAWRGWEVRYSMIRPSRNATRTRTPVNRSGWVPSLLQMAHA